MNLSKRSIRFGLLVTAASLAGAAAFAAAPPAGTRIGNQAAATYTNASGDTVTVTSNKVETVVQQVAGVDIEADVSETAAAGGKVFLPHTIENTGNGDDSYDLTTADQAGDYDFTAIKVFADANLDGVADSTTPITVTPTLAPGQTFGIVIEAVVPTTATSGQSEQIVVTATSTTTGTVTDANTDTITISSGPITELQKSMVVTDLDSNGTDPGDIVTIAINYDSTGLTDAANLTVTDVLDQYLEYQAGTAVWSDAAGNLSDNDGDLTTTDATNGSGHTIALEYDGTDTVSFLISSVPSGRTGRVTFQAIIAADAPAGPISNIANQTVEDPTNPGVPVTMPPSNEPTITVVEINQVTIADRESASYKVDPDDATNLTGTVVSANDDDGTADDIVTDSTDVEQGATIPFDFVVTNHSNGDQTFDITYADVDFPPGTTFQLVGADGVSPLAGSIGPLAPGATQKVFLVATLPAGLAPTTTTNYTALVTATPTGAGVANTATAEFTGAVTAAAVDLTNNATDGGGGVGDNPTDGGSPWHNEVTDPGVPATYTLDITNQGGTADNYDLTVTGLPTGYTAVFQLPDGTVITNTGDIPAGSTQTVELIVTPPADAAPTTAPDDFTVGITSPVSGQGDTIVNSIEVNKIVDLVITQDQTRQAAPNGVLDIPHVLRNDGNVTITEGALASSGFTTFSSALYYDANDNNVADAGDIIIDNIDDIPGGLAPGAEVPLVLRVQVPSTAVSGTTEIENIAVATALNSGAELDGDTSDNAVTDTITIISGDVTLTKQQVLDPGCDGGETGYTTALITNAKPGECISYRLLAENTGTDNADAVTITDSTPAWTLFTECPDGAGGNDCTISLTGGTTTSSTKPAEGAAGQVEGQFGTLIPGGTAELIFSVKIAQ